MIGGIYLLAFIDPATGRHARYKHAAHYLGWTSNFHFRIAHHINGSGARLPAVVREAGLDLVVVRTWPGASRVEERRLKNRGSLARQCPLCRASHPHGDAIGPPESFRGLYETLLPARHHPHYPGVPVGA